MTGLEIWAIALALAMDCFAVSVSGGMTMKCRNWAVIIKNSLAFGLFQMLMPIIGWSCARWLSRFIMDYDHWIAFTLLLLLGAKMIYESLKSGKDKECQFNPCSNRTVMVMAMATSIDALAVGISFAFLHGSGFESIIFPVAVIGLVSFALSAFGFIGGSLFSNMKRLKPELLGGVILIAIGLKILIEHIMNGI